MTNIVIRRRRPVNAPDTTAPIISAISAVPGLVQWATDEPATSTVEYGTGSGADYYPTVVDDGPIAYWRLGEASGATAADEIGTADGTYTNTPTLGATGLISGADTAVTFARASNQYVSVSDMPAGSSGGASIEVWVKFTAVGYEYIHTFVRWGAQSSTVPFHWFYYDDRTGEDALYWQFSDGTATRTAAVAWAPSAGTAYHVVAVHDYTAETVKFYINGSQQGSTVDVSAYATPSAISAAASTLIASYSSTLHSLDGTLDEVAIYGAALTSTQVGDHYTASTSTGSYAYSITTSHPTYVLSHSLSIPLLVNGWHYRVISTDLAGNTATSADQTLTVGSLQDIIDAATAGDTVSLAGLSFTAGATVDKALTLVGGTITISTNAPALTVTASNVTIDGMTLTGPQYEDVDSHTNENGIYVATDISNLTIRNCTISSWGMSGMWLDGVTNLTISDNVITNTGYMGICVASGVGGTISYNTVTGVGESFYTGGARTSVGENCYGIALTQSRTMSVRTSGFTVSHNVVEDVTPWHAFDTHGGLDITFTANTSRNSRCGFFITTGTYGPDTVYVDGNRIETYTNPDNGYSSAGSIIAIAFIGSTDCTAIGNEIDDGYPIYSSYPTAGNNRVLNYQAANVNLAVSGNTLI